MNDTQQDSEDTEERDLRMVKAHCAQLAEHFETVEIFVTRHTGDEDGTIAANWGAGNWYARFGQIQTWVRTNKK